MYAMLSHMKHLTTYSHPLSVSWISYMITSMNGALFIVAEERLLVARLK
jgi:hypothetical protein